MLELFFQQIILDLELEPISPKDEHQQFWISLNENLKICVKELEIGLLFRSLIGPCPTLKKEELYIWLMKANLLGQGTGGAVLGMDSDEKWITFSLSLPFEMNYKTFKEALEEFANYTDYWKEELIRHQKNAEESLL
jgi:hypothetical protein